MSVARATTFGVSTGFFGAASRQLACYFSDNFNASFRTDQPCPSGRERNFEAHRGGGQEANLSQLSDFQYAKTLFLIRLYRLLPGQQHFLAQKLPFLLSKDDKNTSVLGELAG
ncbi:MAG: hypothetical protein MUC97_06630 [Bernardetiaceae bacterium]|nr:hypothetical protein [Bernardetiaceae bacterium]